MVSEFILAALLLGLGVVVVVSTLYFIARLLEWSKNKPLPGANSRIFNIAVLSIVAAIAMLVLMDVELIFLFFTVRTNLVALEEIDLLATGVLLLLIAFVFITLRRIEKET